MGEVTRWVATVRTAEVGWEAVGAGRWRDPLHLGRPEGRINLQTTKRMRSQRRAKRLWMLLACVLVSSWACAAEQAHVGPTEGATSLDEMALWERLPLPDDAEIIPVVEGIDLGFATRMIEPEIFDFYAAWLREEGWRQQAPTEAMVTLPHQIWRKNGAELRIEIQGLDEQSRTVVWLQVKEE